MAHLRDPVTGQKCFGRCVWLGPEGEEDSAHIVVDIEFEDDDTDGGYDGSSYFVAACEDKIVRRTPKGITPLHTKTETRQRRIPICVSCEERFRLMKGKKS